MDLETGEPVTTEYFYNGSILAGQKTGDDVLIFMYDNNGDIFGFTYNGTPYYYIKNAQNDVFLILDENGRAVVLYQYDSWGKVTRGYDATDFNLASINPIMYRSYYVDLEMGMFVYYLNSRYYIADWGRFASADGYVQTGQGMLDKNMFAYCANNPVMFCDPSGCSYEITIKATGNSGWYEVHQNESDKNNYSVIYKEGSYTVLTNAVNITNKLNTAMKNNSQTFDKYSKEHNLVDTSLFFMENVKPGGAWDFKAQDDWGLNNKTSYIYNNTVLRYDDIGNMHYGYVGRIVYSKEILLFMGGFVQVCTGTTKLEYITSNFDDPRDQEMILYGYLLWDQGEII